ncbi:uncharacterized protein LOC132745279 [Ruditapes philippinarum]|uniref:uncharacterized protein LOC132745279 n=1 Tax=Ruditapes philippinarum TaxID=129788 RepID=UPI00295BFE93|nr:uncharacterized protein LOC132745279 [Ruditapes philippinarum]
MIFVNLFLRIVFILVLFVGIIFANQEEPVCTSRFDYDHKMLQKMIMLEIEQRNTKTMLEEIKAALSKQKDESNQDKSMLKTIEEKVRTIESMNSLAGTGNAYVRWGRTQCPENGTELVYKGYAGGSHYSNKGASANYLCLPEEPLWNVYEDAEQTGGTVWGAEYELYGRNMNNFFEKGVAEHDVPCCVCRTNRASILMIPGRNKCYDGWTLEYEGYLSGGHDTHHAAEFVCLDTEPEVVEGGHADKNGKLFYFAEARCGSLRCPPYVNGRELTCAVCSK